MVMVMIDIMTNFDIVGCFSEEIIAKLGLNIEVGTEILLSMPTLEHIKKDHPEIIGDHKAIIADIIAAPLGVSRRKKDGSIGFFKDHENGIQYFLELSVRPSNIGEYFVRTLHHIQIERVEKRVKKGAILLLTNEKIPAII